MLEGDDATAYVLSRHAVVVQLDAGRWFFAHGALGTRRIFETTAATFLQLFKTPRVWSDSVALAVERGLVEAPADRSDPAWQQPLRRFRTEMLNGGLLVPAHADEEALLRQRIVEQYSGAKDDWRRVALTELENVYQPVLLAPPLDARAPALTERARFLVLGWCFTQSVKPLLEQLGASRGVDVAVTLGFHDDLHLIAEAQPDVVVLQLSHRLLLAPILDQFHRLDVAERKKAIAAGAAFVRDAIDRAAEKAKGRLLLVQGVAAPQTSPLGLDEPKSFPGVFDAVHALNLAARESLAARADALFIDEEQLLARHGKRWLLDDLVSTYSHHGALEADAVPALAQQRLEAFGVTDRLLVHRVFAAAYLDAWQAHRGQRAIRCIAVDLDHTLWPGEIADDAFSFADEEVSVALMYGRHGGLHQALRILQQRGILLAVVSKNTHAQVLAKWKLDQLPVAYGVKPEHTTHQLKPDDFVRLKIGWGSKVTALRELSAELGITFDQLAFIDDNPVEREEVRQALPQVMVLGDSLDRVRETLLTHPRFEVLGATAEAAQRTATTRARLARDELASAAPDRAAFLKSLEVVCRVTRTTEGAGLTRASELLQRTHQFNTTGLRLTVAELQQRLARGSTTLLTMAVRDRFADYGGVGVALVERGTLSAFAMSCRVLGVEAENVLLRAALEAAKEQGPALIAPWVPTDRNLPASRLFTVDGFERLADGSGYRFSFERHALPPWPAHCTVS